MPLACFPSSLQSGDTAKTNKSNLIISGKEHFLVKLEKCIFGEELDVQFLEFMSIENLIGILIFEIK